MTTASIILFFFGVQSGPTPPSDTAPENAVLSAGDLPEHNLNTPATMVLGDSGG